MSAAKPLKVSGGSIKEFISTDTLAINNGGTGNGTAAAAFNALAPTQSGNNGLFLGTDGSNPVWTTIREQLRRTGQGYISENFPLEAAGAGASLMVTQRVEYALVGFLKNDIITNINVVVGTGGTGSTVVYVAVYSSAGTRLAVSNNLTTALDSTGMKSLALTAPYTILADGAYYLAVLIVSGSPASLLRGASSAAVGAHAAIGSGVRGTATQTGQSTMPSSATFANGSNAYWTGAS